MIESALYYVSPDDRDTWVTMAMAIKSELGESGFEMWDKWSQQSDRYKAGDARSVWRSIKQGGGVTIRTLYRRARDNGYAGQEEAPRYAPDPNRARDEARQIREKQDAAAITAAELLKKASQTWHPYLVKKGFPREHGFVLDKCLLIPMRDVMTRKINTIQMIEAEGKKRFLPGGKAKGSVFILGSGSPTILCEGYATGLSVREAMKSLYSSARVVVCFSAANLIPVSEQMGDFVVADNDESNAGRIYAEKTRLPYWMPEEIGDANDVHQSRGLAYLARELNEMRRCRAVKMTLAASGSRLPGGVSQP